MDVVPDATRPAAYAGPVATSTGYSKVGPVGPAIDPTAMQDRAELHDTAERAPRGTAGVTIRHVSPPSSLATITAPKGDSPDSPKLPPTTTHAAPAQETAA